MRRRLALLGLAAALLIGGALSGAGREVHTRDLFAMDTVMRLNAYGPRAEKALDAAEAELRRLDVLFNAGNPEGELARLNAAGTARVSEDTARILTRASEFYRETGGLFDCTVYPLMEAWGFPTKTYRVPSGAELDAARALVDGSRVQVEDGTVTLGAGQKIDLGAIGKGYAAGRVMEIFREAGVKHAMVSLGGNVQTLGRRPDGRSWRIGLRDPAGDPSSYLAVVEVEDQAVVTSGGYERYFEAEGRGYIHILDPRTGCPAQSDLLSATVVSPDGALADALSTALYIMGLDGALDYWRSHTGFELLLLAGDGTLYATEGLKAEAGRGISVVRRYATE